MTRTPSPLPRSGLLPLGSYDIAPAFASTVGEIRSGWDAVATAIRKALAGGQGTVAIDGFAGVQWDDLRDRLTDACRQAGFDAAWVDTRQFLRPAEEIEELVAPYTGGDDPVFGYLFDGALGGFFRDGAAVRETPAGRSMVVFGPGAAMLCEPDFVVYADVPKDTVQAWIRQGVYDSFVSRTDQSYSERYKRAYYVEWPTFNRHKAALLSGIDLFLDLQRPETPTCMAGATLRTILSELSQHSFRARPWFAPGPWGGQLLKQQVDGLPSDVPNYAWSFELIAPENGIVLEGGERLEVSFDTLMFHAGEAVLGNAWARFGTDFPIRMNYLDTVDGGNLSVQCHPRPGYIRDRFGEPFTQDETYYIVYAEDDASVYHGFRNGIDADRFREALEQSARSGDTVDIPQFVGSYPSQAGELYVIPNGTIHSSGRGNLVLEISATPYLYTFKMYDWVRRGLDGNMRPLNIQRAWDNLYFDRDEDYTRAQLHPQPEQIAAGEGWREVAFRMQDDMFFAVHRYEMTGPIEADLAGQCHVMNVVAGEAVRVSTRGRDAVYHQGETFVVPAAAGKYTLTPIGTDPVHVVKAFVRDDMVS
jgi:mannose-6-phosphate isomerase class I